MKISLNWINDFVDLSGLDIKKLLNQFTLSVAEIDGVEYLGQNVSGVVSGQIVAVHEHPNSKKLHLVDVNTGKGTTQVVCGAPNVREGMIVPFATLGANVNGFLINAVKIAGVESVGMCCSAKEIGVSDDHEGLMELDPATPLGVDITELLPIKDVVFEVDNKSLTNRPDLWGHYGIAREFSALTGRPLKPLQIADLGKFNTLPSVKVEVDSKQCLRYSALTVENVTKQKANPVMQLRLFYAGMRPINLLADLTNYLMLEVGQPMHAFDNQKVKSIQVLDLVKDTKFLTLDGVERTLPSGTMVIASQNTPVAVAGVMGGELSSISNQTTSLLLESANFNATAVRKTAIALGLRSESSSRYEKTLDPELTTLALGRYLYLLKQADGGVKVTSSLTDVYKTKYPKIEIEITKQYIDKYIGQSIPQEKVLSILKSLEFGVVVTKPDHYKVSVPSFRATKDISLACDLVEEITRIYGYDNIVPQSTNQSVSPVNLNQVIDLEYRAKYLLATKFNLNEVHTYLWYDTATNAQLGINPPSDLRLVNALNKENSQIRQTIIPSLLKTVLDNKTTYDQVGVFEIGRVADGLNKQGNANEVRKLGIVLYSKTSLQKDLLLKLKQAVEYLITTEFNQPLEILPKTPTTDYYHPVNNYGLYSAGVYLGEIAMLHPQVKNNITDNGSVCVAEINFDQVINLPTVQVKFEQITKYPTSEFDYSFVIPSDMLYSQISQIANKVKTPLNYSVKFVDLYKTQNESVLTIKVKVWSLTHTLTSQELDEFYNAVLHEFKQHNIFIKQAN